MGDTPDSVFLRWLFNEILKNEMWQLTKFECKMWHETAKNFGRDTILRNFKISARGS